MEKWRKLLYFAPLIFIVCLVFVLNLVFLINHEEKASFPDLPRIELYSEGLTIDQIYKNGKTIAYDATAYFPDDGMYQEIELKGRGNSTFKAEKMPFQIKLSKKTDLFGLGKSKRWILLANYYDNTHLRNALAFYLERELKEQYALDGRFVEVYFNGERQGLYYLTPKIEISKERIDLRDPLGIVVEYDALHYGDKHCYRPKQGSCLTVADLVSDDNESAAMSDFMKSYDELLAAAKKGDYNTVYKYADIDSLVIYYLLSEFSVNPDAYASSFYFYKDGPKSKIYVGPGWDFDYAFGNRRWSFAIDDDFYSPSVSQFQRGLAFGGVKYQNRISGKTVISSPDGSISRLLYYMIDMPEFLSQVKTTYRDRLMGKIDDLKDFIAKNIDNIKYAAIADNERFEFDNFLSEVANLTEWLEGRFEHFDEVYGGH